MALSSPQPNVQTVSTITSFPAPVALTGTISSTGLEVTGTGTLFLTEIVNPNTNFLLYKYIFNPSTGEIMEIEGVRSNTHLKLKHAFAVNLSGAALNVVNNYFYNSISIDPLGAGVIMFTPNSLATTLDENATVNLSNDRGIQPIGLNAEAADAQVTTF